MDYAHIDHLVAQVDLAGHRVLDIGAGNSELAEAMAESGAVVTGIEVDHAKVALAQKLAAGTTMLCGSAEDLPVEDDSQDIACFFFSFHHVPANAQDAAMDEVSRVLATDGRLHIAEPALHGTMTQVLKHLEDETAVSNASIERFDALGKRDGFELAWIIHGWA